MSRVARKWRPSLAVVVAMVCGLLVSIPVLAFMAMRLSSNQFVRETEQSLINQAALLAQVYADAYINLGVQPDGPELAPREVAHWSAPLHPWPPVLNLRRSEVLPPLPDYEPPATAPDAGGAGPDDRAAPLALAEASPPLPVDAPVVAAPDDRAASTEAADTPPPPASRARIAPPDAGTAGLAAPRAQTGGSLVPLPQPGPRASRAQAAASLAVPDPDPDPYQVLAPDLLALAREAGGTTLAGAIFLDARGVNIRPDQPQDLSFAPEVQAALQGRVGSALRDRGESYDRHPLTSISRDTWYRVFVAFPVIVEARVVGVVYMSRTPSSFAKFALAERGGIIAMVLATLAAAGLVALLLLRLLSKPLRTLSAQSRDIATGRLSEPSALPHYGTRELADLGDNMMQMAETLTARSRQIAIYTDHVTHELKSPVTAILGAAELLGSDGITRETAETLRRTIEGQALRMNTLLEKLREMSRLRDAPTRGSGPLRPMLPILPGLDIVVAPDSATELPLLPEHGEIVFQHLAGNAVEHGATTLHVHYRDGVLLIEDNGRGIAPEDLDKVTTPFFTTRRDEGGTGLGLSIVTAVLQNYAAELTLAPADTGTVVRITFPEAQTA